jgi:hypothetical protein
MWRASAAPFRSCVKVAVAVAVKVYDHEHDHSQEPSAIARSAGPLLDEKWAVLLFDVENGC